MMSLARELLCWPGIYYFIGKERSGKYVRIFDIAQIVVIASVFFLNICYKTDTILCLGFTCISSFYIVNGSHEVHDPFLQIEN